MNLWNMKRTATNKWQRAGFTLLELLVVISIIGILTAIGMVAFSNAQQKGRNARRVGDMRAVQNAFEQYAAKNNGSYSSTCSTMATGGGLPALPQEIKTGHTAYSYSCPGTTYCVCATMEGSPAGGNSAASCAFTGGTSHFCVTNLQ